MNFLADSMHWFQAGGPVMYLLLLSSLLAVAVIAERAFYYRKMAEDADAFLVSLTDALHEADARTVAGRYRESAKPLAAVALAGITAAERGRCVEQAMESAAQLAAAKLRKSLSILSTLVTLTPLFGLMGTVIGMIESFSVFHLQGGQPMAITGGVGEALIATATGLAVAVVALVGHSYFAYRLDDMVTDMERVSASVVEHLPVKKNGRSDQHEAA